MAFKRATKTQSKLRLALAGPAGSGKTFTALTLATVLAQGSTPALIDTERGSASKYADLFAFDALELESFHPQRYVEAIGEAAKAGYPVLVIDSLSHAWSGKGGALELVDQAAKRQQSANTFGAWREVTPLHNALVDAMLGAPMHVIVTLRSKQEYVQEKDERGRTTIRKVGLQPIQRDGLEYEFDVYADLDMDNTLIVGKTRCSVLSGLVQPKPGRELGERLLAWLQSGEPALPGANSQAAEALTEQDEAQLQQLFGHALATAPASEHPPGSLEAAWERWQSLAAQARAAGVSFADPPPEASVKTVQLYNEKLFQKLSALVLQPS